MQTRRVGFSQPNLHGSWVCSCSTGANFLALCQGTLLQSRSLPLASRGPAGEGEDVCYWRTRAWHFGTSHFISVSPTGVRKARRSAAAPAACQCKTRAFELRHSMYIYIYLYMYIYIFIYIYIYIYMYIYIYTYIYIYIRDVPFRSVPVRSLIAPVPQSTFRSVP